MQVQERPVAAGPIVCSSAGILLMVIGCLSLLPGRDTAKYLEDGGPRTLNQALAQPVASQARALPSRQTVVAAKGRFYHWDQECKLLHHNRERRKLPVVRATRQDVEASGYFACDFCFRS